MREIALWLKLDFRFFFRNIEFSEEGALNTSWQTSINLQLNLIDKHLQRKTNSLLEAEVIHSICLRMAVLLNFHRLKGKESL